MIQFDSSRKTPLCKESQLRGDELVKLLRYQQVVFAGQLNGSHVTSFGTSCIVVILYCSFLIASCPKVNQNCFGASIEHFD